MTDRHIIGITGPTGAGKGVVADALRHAGVPVLDADALAREVTVAGHPCLAELVDAFTPDILRPNGSLDRRALAERAFASPENTVKLNAITHPYILRLLENRLEEAFAAGAQTVAIDAPLLFESELHKICSYTVAVLAPAGRRQARIMQRDGLNYMAAILRMNAQQNDQYYIDRADEVLYNNGTLEAFRETVAAWVERIL